MNRSFLLGMCIGTVVGAAVGLAIAPGSGPETREQLAEKSKSAAGRVSKVATALAIRVSGSEEKIKQAM
jgi:gas vesicle protein